MKRFLKALLCLSAVSLLAIGCSDNSTGSGDDGDGNNPPGGTAGKVTMTIGGVSWASDVSGATLVTSGTVASMGLAGTRGVSAEAFSFGLAVNGGIAEGTYTYSGAGGPTLVATFVVAADSARNAAFIPVPNAAATVTITDINAADDHVSGTFSFDLSLTNGTGIVEVRDGTFTRIPLTTGVSALQVPAVQSVPGMDAQRMAGAAARTAGDAR